MNDFIVIQSNVEANMLTTHRVITNKNFPCILFESILKLVHLNKSPRWKGFCIEFYIPFLC